MASTTFLLSTAVMGVLIVALALGARRFLKRSEYEPQFRRTESEPAGRSLGTDVVMGALVLIVVAIIGAGLALGQMELILLGIPAVAVIGYIAWGVYHMAQSRGLPFAHSVALSAWLVGVLLVGVIALNLLMA